MAPALCFGCRHRGRVSTHFSETITHCNELTNPGVSVKLAIAYLAAIVSLAACTGGGAPGSSPHEGASPDDSSREVIQPIWAPYQLPAAISGAAVVASHGRLLLVGGRGTGAPANSVVKLNPVTGLERPVAKLAAPVTGAAAAMVRGTLAVFGGGAGRPGARVQSVGPGRAAQVTARLPGARSGLTAVTMGGTTYLIGGSAGSHRPKAVLATVDGTHFSVAARLPVPASFAGAVAYRGKLWIFGGTTASGPTRAIQLADPRTGLARVVGTLPQPVSAASAFVLGGRVFLAGGLTVTAGRTRASSIVLEVDPTTAVATPAATLPMPVAHAAAAVVGRTAYLVGGTDGSRAVPAVVSLRLVPPSQAVPPDPAIAGAANANKRWGPTNPHSMTAAPSAGAVPPGSWVSEVLARRTAIGSVTAVGSAETLTDGADIRAMPWLGPARGPGHLAPGSNPAALPAPVLVADHQNNRLIIIDPHGRVRWVFPRPGDLAPGQTFIAPDDAFFSPDGRYIIATQEDDQVISVIDVATRKIVFRYGKPGSPGMGPNRVDNPDDALLTRSGDIVAADIKNCRVIVIAPPAHRPMRVIGQTTNYCVHAPPGHFASPNGAFPATNGSYIVTEINGDWADSVDLNGHVRWSVHPPGVLYPSDTNEVFPGRYLTADYSNPGQVVEFNRHGRLIWRFGGLNQPSLALPMPNGDILVNDDFNHRIIVIDPRTNRIVWQYGHTGVAGRWPGYLNDPDGVDLVPPDSFLIRHATTMGQP
jgi:hypothetical protein